MKKIIILHLVLIISTLICAQTTVTIQTQSSTGTGSWTSRQAKTVGLLPGYSPISVGSAPDANNYGSNNKISSTATGFFYTKKIGGRWWIIDPEGMAGLNIAMSVVNGLNNDAEIATVYDHLWNLGYNGIGSFLDDENQTIPYNNTHTNNFSYTRRINFFLNYKNSRKSYYPSTPSGISGSLDYIFVLDPKFEEYCDSRAKSFTATFKDERNLLGYFIDNEINFNQDQLENFLNDLAPGDPSYDTAYNFIGNKGITLEQVKAGLLTETVRQEFATLLAEHYYEVTSKALKKYDPNHLNLGSRLNGRPRSIEGVVKASARWCDIVSINFYDAFSPDVTITSTSKYLTWIDAPCLVSEFYIKGLDATTQGYVNGYSGAGWVTKTQSDRGCFYQNTCLELLKSKAFVGWHYFKYQDDSNSNKGIIRTSSKGSGEYTDLTTQMQLLNFNRFKIIDYYDNVSSVETKQIDSIQAYYCDNNLIIHGVDSDFNIEIYDLTGKKRITLHANSNIKSYPLQGLGGGIYVLKFYDKNNTVFFKTKLRI